MVRVTCLVLAAMVFFAGAAYSGKTDVSGLVQGQFEDRVDACSRFLAKSARRGQHAPTP